MQRTFYDKYREYLKKKVEENNYYMDYKQLDLYADYLKNRAVKEENFPLYYYTKFHDDMKLDQLFLFYNSAMNDAFEGIANDQYTDKNSMTEIAATVSEFSLIKSFSESFNHNLMWSHYADDNKGICIEYDFSRIPVECDMWKHIYPVVYFKTRKMQLDMQQVYDSYTSGELDGILETRGTFIQKDSVWKYEKEWRFVYVKGEFEEIENQKKSKVPLILDFPYVKNVYIGPRSYNSREEILDRLNRSIRNQKDRIGVYQMLIDDSTYKMEKSFLGYAN